MKKIPTEIWIIIILIPLLATLANSLNSFFSKGMPFNWKEFLVQAFVGTISGMLFGLLGCWLLGDIQAGIGAISGFGAVVGIAGVSKIAYKMEEWLLKKFD